jgi:hypothetical protein
MRLSRATLGFCGIAPVRGIIFGPIKTSTAEQRGRWLEQARHEGEALRDGALTTMQGVAVVLALPVGAAVGLGPWPADRLDPRQRPVPCAAGRRLAELRHGRRHGARSGDPVHDVGRTPPAKRRPSCDAEGRRDLAPKSRKRGKMNEIRNPGMFTLDRFVADCQAACAADKSHRLVREVVAAAAPDPVAVLRRFEGANEARAAP